MALWRHLLQDYHDPDVLEYTEFGWPINYVSPVEPNIPARNHRSAHTFASHVDSFISKEVALGATMGPFSGNPLACPIHMSPLQTVPKDSDSRRVVLDLSYPGDRSVNSGIVTDSFQDHQYTLRYPSVDSLAKLVREKGRHCLMFKRDLSRCYRQIYTCPGDWHRVAYSWRGAIYFDIVEAFGLRSAAIACQPTTNVVKYLFASQGFTCVDYLDDIASCDISTKAQYAFDSLGQILSTLSLRENTDKATAPNTVMTFLGIQLDSDNFTLSIPTNKLARVRAMLSTWVNKTTATRSQIRSLLRTLNHISACVRPGRTFISRMLNTLQGFPHDAHQVVLDSDFQKDVHWWIACIADHNGVSIMAELEWSQPDGVFSSDASSHGIGGFYQGLYFHAAFPTHLQDHPINHKELLAVMVALKLWAPRWAGQNIKLLCDNMCSVSVINNSRARVIFLQGCLREIRYLEALHSIHISAVHISSGDNRISDHLSRWESSPQHSVMFSDLTRDYQLVDCPVHPGLFDFTHPW